MSMDLLTLVISYERNHNYVTCLYLASFTSITFFKLQVLGVSVLPFFLWLNNILLDGRATFGLSRASTLSYFHCLAIMNNVAVNVCA